MNNADWVVMPGEGTVGLSETGSDAVLAHAVINIKKISIKANCMCRMGRYLILFHAGNHFEISTYMNDHNNFIISGSKSGNIDGSEDLYTCGIQFC